MGSSPRSVRTQREVPHTSYTGGGTPTDECNLSFKAKLMKPTVATSELKVGDMLLISLDANDGIATYDSAKNFCGYISETIFEKKMIECLKKGSDYHAQVLKKIGQSCEVKVYGA